MISALIDNIDSCRSAVGVRGKATAAAEIADSEEYGNHLPPPALRKVPQWNSPSFPIDKMTELLDHDNHQMRKDFRKFVSDPGMRYANLRMIVFNPRRQL
jgi:hypothetical protein